MRHPDIRPCAAGLVVAMFCAGAAHAQAPNPGAIPDFSGVGSGWRMINSNATNYVDPPTGPKPVTFDPRYPHVGNLQPGQKTDRVADLSTPLLKDWAKEQMKKTNDEVILEDKIPFVATSLCWPAGVPTQLLVPTRVFFLQEPDMVTMLFERDQQIRRVYLNHKHSANPKPGWFGESVGHYEGGDTLVIDTIALSDHPFSFVDNFRTPHTEALHVVERWKMINGGQQIEVSFTVEDPRTFNMPWAGLMRYRRDNQGPMEEFVCAENHRPMGREAYSIPEDTTPDF
jgi:hypothetical protein